MTAWITAGTSLTRLPRGDPSAERVSLQAVLLVVTPPPPPPPPPHTHTLPRNIVGGYFNHRVRLLFCLSMCPGFVQEVASELLNIL